MGLIIMLLIVGLLLLLAELFIIPGFGVSGIMGLASFVGAVVLSFTQHGTTIGLIVLFSSLAVCAVAIFFILRSKTWQKLSLKQSIDNKSVPSPEEHGIAVGMEGVAITRLNPVGNGRFGDITAEITSDSGFLDSKTPVRVVRIDGTKVFVTPVS